MIGKTVSHYKILEKIGEGGMGVVYRAEDTKLKRFVALKFLPSHLTTERDAVERFQREAQAAAALNHPNIITIHDIGEYEGQVYMAMEHVAGRTLRALLDEKPLSLSRCLDIAMQIAEGLSKAHEANIVHRDIKPENVLVSSDGRAKILDFGLAKLHGLTKITKEASTLGTVYYMSPEQTRGEDVDQRSDIFSFGAVLYETVTGQLPFQGDHLAAVSYAILTDTPPPLRRFNNEVSDDLERIVFKALSKSPDERYQHVSDMLVDLRRLRNELQTGQSIQTPAVTPISPKPRRSRAAILGVMAAVVVFGFATVYFLKPTTSPSLDRKSIAVLPFQNLSENKENEYFSDGITEDIIAQLSKIGDLKVISRTSSMQYRDTNKSLRTIGDELGVATVLEGSVRRYGNQVRIVAQLVDASTDDHLWAETYDKEITELFAIQSDVAQAIASALQARLSPEERDRIEAIPTDNLDAYQAYLRGHSYVEIRTEFLEEDFSLGIQMFERAIELDPNFALAHAAMSKAHSGIYHFGYDRSDERLASAKAAADRALELQPDLPEAHVALGYYYYWGLRQYGKALDALADARELRPNDTEILEAGAWIKRRRGELESAIEDIERSFDLNPRDATLPQHVGETHMYLREYAKAEHAYDKSIAIAPDQQLTYILKVMNACLWTGDTQKGREILESMPRKRSDVSTFSWFYQEFCERDYAEALNRVAELESYEDQWRFSPRAQLEGFIHSLNSEPDLARESFETARLILEAEINKRPDDHRVRSSLGIVYAGLGRTEDAIREAKLAVKLYPVSKDALIGPSRIKDLALVYTMVGDYDAALDQIDYLLSIPAFFSVPMLELDPLWGPLRDHPRFQVLLEKYSTDDS
jgi:non-specific serine/threonine protein kinase